MLSKEQHDQLLVELVDGNTMEGRKSIIVADLAKDYEDSLKQHEEKEKERESLKDENKLLLEAHHRLFKQSSFGFGKEEEKPVHKITLEEIERRNMRY
jgi:hypothetical protein